MAQNLLLWFLVYLTGVNLAAFFLYGLDKYRARRKQWRIPEHTLLLLAFLGGCVGAAVGMALFHHKTRKTRFRDLYPPGYCALDGDCGPFWGQICVLALVLDEKEAKNLQNC